MKSIVYITATNPGVYYSRSTSEDLHFSEEPRGLVALASLTRDITDATTNYPPVSTNKTTVIRTQISYIIFHKLQMKQQLKMMNQKYLDIIADHIVEAMLNNNITLCGIIIEK